MEHSIILSAESNYLTKREGLIYQAYLKPAIKLLSDSQRIRIATQVVGLSKAKLGLKDKNKGEEEMDIKLILTDLEAFGNYSEDDIMIAVNNGLNGEYLNQSETTVFFNSSIFVQWIKKYYYEKNEVLSKVAKEKQKEEKTPVPTDQELKKQAIDTANEYANQIRFCEKNDKKFTFIAGGLSILFDYLEQFKIPTISKEERIELWNKYSTIQDIEERKMHCKTQGYIKFVNSLVTFDCFIDNDGTIKPNEK
jgi:hypothetical protein